MMRVVLSGWLVVLMACFPGSSAMAGIIATGGDIFIHENPLPTVYKGEKESNGKIRTFQEASNVSLVQGLDVNISESGAYDDVGDLTPATIPTTTLVNSYFLHFDPVGNDAAVTAGWIEFDQAILGIIVERVELLASDGVVGSPSTAYDHGALELNSGVNPNTSDALSFSGNRLEVELHAASFDHMRVVTEAIPEPGMISIMTVFGGALCAIRRWFPSI